jgi:NitT/TauT family transport system permease protein
MIDSKDRILRVALPLALAVALLGVWQVMADLGALNRALFPSPVSIVASLFGIKGFWGHAGWSVLRLFAAVAAGSVLGVAFGVAMGRGSGGPLEDAVAFVMSIPGISWAPLFIMIVGFGELPMFIVGVITSFFPVAFNVHQGYRDIDRNFLRIASVLDYGGAALLFRVELPAMANYLILAVRNAFSRTWKTVIAVEMIAATGFGLGYVIFDARELLNTRRMYAGILVSGLVFVILDSTLFGLLDVLTVKRWGMKRDA